MGKFLLGLVVVLSSVVSTAQDNYPKNAFSPPLDIPIILAATFGELRSNHFHSGIDIKTQHRQGFPIYTIGEGTVVRIKVSHWGFGKALYVAHPNGYTSVYAHLQKFSPEIEHYVKQIQYKKRSYEIEVFPEYGEITVEKGKLIAYSGDTGGSTAPHLHFEIRNSISEKPTNPLLFGLEAQDATNPTLVGLFGYPLSENAQLNQSSLKSKINFTKQKDGTFLADKVTALGTIGFGFIGFDRLDMAANKNGIYSVKQVVNGKVYTDYNFEDFSFSETRYINTLIDYDHFGKYKKYIQKCFKSPGNRLSIYNTMVNDGKIEIKEGLSYKVELLIQDLKGNLTKAIIPVVGKRETIKIKNEPRKTDTYVIAKRPNNYDLDLAKVYFPANTFYEDFYIDLQTGTDTITIHNNRIPAHRNFTITFDVSKYTANERKQLFVARLDKDLKANYASTYKRGTTFTTRTRNLGTYTLAKDTLAPKIRTKNFKHRQWLNNFRYLSLIISDDLSGIDSYHATLNGEWILMEYEPKTKTLTYNFDDKILDKKQCELKVVVKDNVGNTNTLNVSFYRK